MWESISPNDDYLRTPGRAPIFVVTLTHTGTIDYGDNDPAEAGVTAGQDAEGKADGETGRKKKKNKKKKMKNKEDDGVDRGAEAEDALEETRPVTPPPTMVYEPSMRDFQRSTRSLVADVCLLPCVCGESA